MKIHNIFAELLCPLKPVWYLSGGAVFGHMWEIDEEKPHPIFRYIIQVQKCSKCGKSKVVSDPRGFIYKHA